MWVMVGASAFSSSSPFPSPQRGRKSAATRLVILHAMRTLRLGMRFCYKKS
jgi:hypothetical protein